MRSEKSGGGGTWSLAGGALETNEAPETGIQREIAEETELEVDALRPFHTFSQLDNEGDPTVMIGYTCRALSETVVLNWEHDDFRWCSLEEAFRLSNLGKHARIFLEDFRERASSK